MPLCTCTHCKALTNGIGKEIHRTTVIRHMKKEQEEQELENAYQKRSSPMEISEISDNEEILIEEENLTTLHNDEASMEILSSFQDEDEEIDDYYHESDDLNHYDSQSELEFDTSDDKEEKEKKTWPVHRVYSNELYVHEYEFYSPFVNCVLTKNEVIKLKQCYAAIFQKNTSEITDIKENYAKYGKLRTKDGNIISSKWWKKENDSSRNDFCVA
ncbi:19894_t:CDS:2, partial [Rhizophagus irregularis]